VSEEHDEFDQEVELDAETVQEIINWAVGVSGIMLSIETDVEALEQEPDKMELIREYTQMVDIIASQIPEAIVEPARAIAQARLNELREAEEAAVEEFRREIERFNAGEE